jgi:hypothetical protein
MNRGPEARAVLKHACDLLDRIPDDIYVGWGSGMRAGLDFQVHSQADVRRVRALFPGTFWTKKYHEGLKWWTYDTTFEGVALHIYAVSEAPPTCHAIEEEYEAVEYDFPAGVSYPKKTVTKTRLRWVCSDGAAVSEASQ